MTTLKTIQCYRCDKLFTPHKDWHAYCETCAHHLIRIGVNTEEWLSKVQAHLSHLSKNAN